MTHELLVGVFDDPDRLLATTHRVREAGVEIEDVYTPFPVHGLDEAMGLRPTRLGIACFLFGTLGALVALSFQLWVTTMDWPTNIGGKSYNALPALIPIAFEVTVLFAALGTVFTFLARAGLHPGKTVSDLHPGVTDDRFVITVHSRVGPGRLDEARRLMECGGALTTTTKEVEA